MIIQLFTIILDILPIYFIDGLLHVRVVLKHDLVAFEWLISQSELQVSAASVLLQLFIHVDESVISRNFVWQDSF